ncbi:MAG: bifunctional protein-serine/threonine kinase/phosphatase, partial [Proteobacteria bacterium]|nr:bifunctional protein-serine/threonine kinase/phosphatase [Pseudomonadota bacterium]
MSAATAAGAVHQTLASRPLAYQITDNNVVEMNAGSKDPGTLQLEFGGYSTAGLKNVNQDAFAVLQPETSVRKYKGAVAAIADGVSCSERSQEASQLSVTDFISDYYSTPDTWTVKDSAARVLNALNAWLFQHGNQGPGQHGELVTTFSSVIFKDHTAHIFHAGDSRIYRFRQDKLQQITRDHSEPGGSNNTILTNALGMGAHLEVDYVQKDLKLGDIFLLSTDGVHDFLPEEELRQFLREDAQTLESLAQRITSTALSKGSNDNLSCLLLKVTSLPLETPREAPRNIANYIVPPKMEPGMRIDAFKVLEILHSSAQNHLYLVARDGDNERLVLKAPSAGFVDKPEYLEAFNREQWIGKKIDSPNVMQVHDRPGDTPFLYNIYEYIPSQNLRQWMHDNPNPAIGRVRNIVDQIARGLRAFQRQGMLYRALKPEDVLIDKDGRAKLINFGTVQVSGLAAIKPFAPDAGNDSSNSYKAPEYLRGDQGTFRSDIFSLGVIAYEMLCGELPCKTSRRWQYRSIRQHREDIPLWIDAALKKATAPSPKERYPALSELCQDLRTPNKSLASQLEHAPLLERNP